MDERSVSNVLPISMTAFHVNESLSFDNLDNQDKTQTFS